MSSQTMITAHSGADGTPDNSLVFVRHALTLPVDALEVDVRRGADGAPALGHDAAGSDAPRLDEVFALVQAHPSMQINCDLKEPGLEETVYRLALSHGLGGRVVFSGTVDARATERIPGLQGAVDIYLNLEEYVPELYRRYRDIPDFELQAADTICRVCAAYGIGTVNMNQTLVTLRFCDTLAAHGLGISVWTVDWPEEMEWFFTYGVCNVTTRRPQAALTVRQRV